jgi:hypothetical protein
MTKKNFQVNKSVLNYIKAENFWQEGDAEKFFAVSSNLKFVPKEYGFEIDHFNMVDPELEMVFGELLGDYVKIEDDTSGVFRMPYPVIHFENFDSLREWRLAIAVQDNVFRTYHHISDRKDARNGIDNINFFDPEEFKLETQINLKQNDAIFYRPWIFHSFEDKIIHCYKILVQE